MIAGKEKIHQSHLARLAYVYVRQSSPKQVLSNLESQRMQYDLHAEVEALGWSSESIRILDEDLGVSANGTHKRSGFSALCALVCEGDVGIIMSLETSRLARSNREWYRLLDLCAVRQTVVAEPGRVYDPGDDDDRLHLGLKSLINEAELHRLKARLGDAAQRKAERGELKQKLPVGLVYGPDGEVLLDPDQGVQQLIHSVLGKFDELRTARKVLRWMIENGLKMPRRIGSGLFSEVRWQEPTYAAIRDLLHNPRYAGAYVRGKSEGYLKIQNEEPRQFRRHLPIEKWKVKIPESHPGYISWEQYLSHRQRLAENNTRKQGARGTPGRGAALLQGLIRCGKCAARMQVTYRKRNDADGIEHTEIYYRCSSATARHLAPPCQGVARISVDPIVCDAFLKALEPATLDIAEETTRKLQESSRAAERHWHFNLERARYEAEKARRQYDHVEPENRLIARELERRWEARLRETKRLEEEFARWKHERSQSWKDEEIGELRDIVKNVPALWKAETTSNEDRKELLRLLIDDVWVWTDRERRKVRVKILWKGGCRTAHEGRWRLGGKTLAVPTLDRLRELAALGLSDRWIAIYLNREGYRRTDGKPFVGHNITHTRLRHSIDKPSTARDSGVYNLKETARDLGVSPAWLRQLIHAGRLDAQRDPHSHQWRLRLSEEDLARLRPGSKGLHEWTPSEAADYLDTNCNKVYKWIARGELTARKICRGRRSFCLIPAKEVQALARRLASRGGQRALDGTAEVQDEG